MNLQEILSEINKNIDDEIETTEAIDWVNRGIEDLSLVANLQSIATINTLANQIQYTLPSDLVELLQIVKDGQIYKPLAISDLTSYGYKQLNNAILLQPIPTEDGTMDIYYKSMIPYLSDMEDIPQIPIFFHDLLVLFVVAKFKFQDQDSEYMQIAANTYDSKKQKFIDYMNKRDVPNQVIDIYGMCWNE